MVVLLRHGHVSARGAKRRYAPAMLRLRHSLRLAWEIGAFARLNRTWWLLLVAPAVAVALAATSTTQVVVPYTVYTMF